MTITGPIQTGQRLSPSPARHPSWLLAGFWVCFVIAVAVVVRRLVALAYPSQGGPPQMVALNDTFSSHAGLTLIHIIPAAVFVILAAFVLLRQTEVKWVEKPFFLFGAITGLTAYAMSAFAIGGWIERSAVLVFDTWFLVSLGRAYWLSLRGDNERKRSWITRAVAILLGISTTRPVMGVLFATSGLTHLTPKQFFGIAFWIGFSINTVVIELWLHSRRRLQLQKRAAVTPFAGLRDERNVLHT